MYFIITNNDMDEEFKNVIKHGSFDNGSGYILCWYISNENYQHETIIAKFEIKSENIPRYFLWNDTETTYFKEHKFCDFLSNQDVHLLQNVYNWILIDTLQEFTANPYKF
jgi:hypothetical protein